MHNPSIPMQSQPLSSTHFKVGDKVTYTNEYGAVFTGHTIQGFPTAKDLAKKAYIDTSCYWVAKHFSSLSIENKPNFRFFEFYPLSTTHLVDRAIAYSKPISQIDFEQYIPESTLATARTSISAYFAKNEYLHLFEAITQWEFKNPRMGISDGSLGRHQCLTLLVELGEELLAFDAGKAWNHLAQPTDPKAQPGL